MAISEEGMKVVIGQEAGYGNRAYDHSFVIKVRLNHEATESERDAIYVASTILEDAFLKGAHEVDPKVHERAAKTKTEILACFGDQLVFVEEIPNEYCSRGCCAFYPWFIVTTKIGRIKIGWRKSVIHLEWTDSAIKADASMIFPREEAWPGYETTAYNKVIHAHGYDKAAEYIARLEAFHDSKLEAKSCAQ
jgi:hypothetical protein